MWRWSTGDLDQDLQIHSKKTKKTQLLFKAWTRFERSCSSTRCWITSGLSPNASLPDSPANIHERLGWMCYARWVANATYKTTGVPTSYLAASFIIATPGKNNGNRDSAQVTHLLNFPRRVKCKQLCVTLRHPLVSDATFCCSLPTRVSFTSLSTSSPTMPNTWKIKASSSGSHLLVFHQYHIHQDLLYLFHYHYPAKRTQKQHPQTNYSPCTSPLPLEVLHAPFRSEPQNPGSTPRQAKESRGQ